MSRRSTPLAEMYLHGVSTRKVSALLEQLGGDAVSSTEVSRAAQLLDEALEAWRTQPLGEMGDLLLDAHFEKVRENGQMRDAAVLIGGAVNPQGQRRILGVSVSLSEREVYWRTFLQSLIAGGLGGVQLILSDAYASLKAARHTVLGAIPWHRCQHHLQPNAQAYVPHQEMGPKLPPTFARFSTHLTVSRRKGT